MPNVLKCPQCEAIVRVSDGMGVNSLVCCPVCSEEFLLGEFQDPGLPELVVLKAVPDPETEPAPSESESKGESETESDREGAFDFPAVAEKEEAAVAVWGQDESPPEETEADTEADSVEDIPVPVAEQTDEFAFQGNVRRRKETNVGLFLLMNVLGGVFGLLVAYYALCWFGFAGGLPKMPLPLLPHTMHWNGAVAGWARSLTADTQITDKERDADATEEPRAEKDTDAPAPPPERKKRTLAKGDVGPKEPTEYYALSELDARVKEAEAALVEDGGFSRASYRKFCRLGELLPFTEPSAELSQRAEQIRMMLGHYGVGKKNEDAIARLANIVLSYSDWPEPGILVAGEVRETAKKNGLHEALVWLPFYKKVVTVLSGENLNLKKGRQVLVLGRIIKNPSDSIVGYRSDHPRVIWKGLVVTPHED